jgi:hypothetical protein
VKRARTLPSPRRAPSRGVVLLAALATLAVLLGHEAESSAKEGELEGVGVAPVVGENLDSARSRALLAAKRDALVKALSLVVSASQAVPDSFLARASDYISTYRVLDEAQAGATFTIRIVADIDRERLRRDLTGASPRTGAVKETPTAVAGRAPRVAVVLHPGEGGDALDEGAAARIGRLVESALADAGLEGLRLETGGPAPGDLAAEATRRGATVLLEGRASATVEPGVRGLALAAVKARATLTATRLAAAAPVGGAVAPASSTEEAWGFAATDPGARAAATASAVLAAVRSLADTLRQPAPGGTNPPGPPERVSFVGISGLTSPAHYESIVQALCESAGARLTCRPQRFRRNLAWLAVRTDLGVLELVRVIEKLRIEGSPLRARRSSRDTVWIEAAPRPTQGGS